MSNYRRLYVPGGSYFFTVNLQDRTQTLLTDHIDALYTAILDVKSRHPFSINEYVILPDHLHMGERSKRYLLIVRNGVVQRVNIERTVIEFTCTGPEDLDADSLAF